MRVGTHVIAELHGCPRDKLESVEVVRVLMQKIVDEANFKAVGDRFHQFKPVGVTGVIVLAESHFSIHTWPEKNMLAADIFTCGNEGNAKEGYELLCKYFEPKTKKVQVIER